MIDWLKRRFDQEGLLITFIVIGLIIGVILFFRRPNQGGVKNNTGTINQFYGAKKRLTPFIEAYGATGSSNRQAEVGARVGLRLEF